MSQNQTHGKQIARALVERTGMPYTRARRAVSVAEDAGLLPHPFTPEAMPALLEVLCSPRVETLLSASDSARGGGAGGGTGEDADALPPFRRRTTSPRAVGYALRRLAKLLKAGCGLGHALAVCAEDARTPELREALFQIARTVGESPHVLLSSEFAKHPDVFDAFVVTMLQAGERVGSFGDTLQAAADTLIAE